MDEVTKSNNTELTIWIWEYLILRGQIWMINLAMLKPMPAALQEAAETESQDMIGWEEFFHCMVTTNFQQIQNAHCIMASTTINGAN